MGIRTVVAATAIGVVGMGLLSACDWDVSTESYSDSADIGQSFQSVRFANDSGNVRIRTGGSSTVKREVHYRDEKPGDTFRVRGGVLELDSCEKPGCWIEYEVTVPEGTKVTGQLDSGTADIRGVAEATVRSSSGRVSVKDVSGPVNVEADSGRLELADIDGAVVAKADSSSVEVDRVRGDLTLEASSGSVEARGIEGSTQVKSTSGRVVVELAKQQSVRVDGDSGSVEVTVPNGDYEVVASTDSGNVDSDIDNDPSAEHRIDLHTDSGNISVSAA